MKAIRTAWEILEPATRARAGALLAANVAMAALDAASVAMVLPFFAALLGRDMNVRVGTLLGSWFAISPVAQGACLLVVAVIAKNLAALGCARLNARFLADVQARVAARLFAHYLDQGYPFHVRRGSAALFHELQNTAAAFGAQILRPALDVVVEVAVFCLLVAAVFLTHPRAGLLSVGVISLCAVLILRFTRARLASLSNEWLRRSEASARVAHQVLGGIKDVKLACAEDHFAAEHARAANSFAEVHARHAEASALPRALIETSSIAAIAIAIVAASASTDGTATAVWLGLVGAAALRLVPGAQRIAGNMGLIRSSTWCLDVLGSFDAPAGDAQQGDLPAEIGRSIRLADVHFSHDGTRDLIRGASLDLARGRITGLCGRSGEGKSTLAHIVCGLLPVRRCQLIVDGVAVDPASRAWRRRIAFVSQDPFLLDASIRTNVAFGAADARIDDARVRQSLQLAGIADFVESLPAGIETKIGERGATLSGGQVQRLALARAVYRRPALLVLDEPTNSLDGRTERAVLDALERLKHECAILLVAHHPQALSICDRVHELADGVVRPAAASPARPAEDAQPSEALA